VKQVVSESQSAVDANRGAGDADAVPPMPRRHNPPTKSEIPQAAATHFLTWLLAQDVEACVEEKFMRVNLKRREAH
jgi:hypothetical protein